MNKIEIKSIEKKIIKDKELLSLIKKKYKSISKINIDEFIDENNETLKKMNSNRNWKIWLTSIKKKYKKEINEFKKEKEKEPTTPRDKPPWWIGEDPRDKIEDEGKGTGLERNDDSDESMSDEPGQGKIEADKNKQREKERKKKRETKLKNN